MVSGPSYQRDSSHRKKPQKETISERLENTECVILLHIPTTYTLVKR